MGKLILVLITILGLFVIYKRFNSIRKGEVAEDELSKLLLQKAASLSFYISLYYWIVISYFSDTLNLETSQLINYGIIGMALIFIIMIAITKLFGFKKETL